MPAGVLPIHVRARVLLSRSSYLQRYALNVTVLFKKLIQNAKLAAIQLIVI